MGYTFVSCHRADEDPDEKGFWAWDPYSAVIMFLVGQQFLAAQDIQWKQQVGSELIEEAINGIGSTMEPNIWQHNESKDKLLAFRAAYVAVEDLLSEMGDVITGDYLISHGMKGIVHSGSQGMSVAHIRDDVKKTIALIDEYINYKFGGVT